MSGSWPTGKESVAGGPPRILGPTSARHFPFNTESFCPNMRHSPSGRFSSSIPQTRFWRASGALWLSARSLAGTELFGNPPNGESFQTQQNA